MLCLLLLLLCLFGLNSGLPQYGIMGGNVTDISKVPYQAAALVSHPDPDLYCGATIISEHYLLLGGRCCDGLDQISFRVGSNYWEKGGTLLSSEKLFVHPKYSMDSGYPVYDVCVAKVSTAIEFGPNVQPLKVSDRAPDAGDLALVAGWGIVTENGEVSNVLRSVRVPVKSEASCREVYPMITNMETFLCAGGEEGKSPNAGDGGGALQWKNSTVGIASFGIHIGEEGFPVVYTNVYFPEIRKFIRDVAGV